MGRIIGFLLWALTLAAPSQAAWFEASSAHFIIDADSSEARIRDFATRLERFDEVLRTVYGVQDDPSRHSNRIHLFATSVSTIEKACGDTCRGFYVPRAGGSVIYTAALSSASDSEFDLTAQEVLLHEYSHHFMFSNFPHAYPMWFTEGFAEYNANVRFDPDGTVEIGRPPNYRAYGLFSHQDLPVRELLNPSMRDLHDDTTLDVIYGRAWLLVHYLLMDKQRHKQLDVYLDNLNQGKSSLDAAHIAFGDLNKLNRALDDYLRNNRFVELRVHLSDQPITVKVESLSRGAAAMMPVHMRSTRGVTLEEAKQLLPQATKLAAPYPNDPRVQVELAEAEFDAGQIDDADAAADRALVAEPDNVEAMLYKGRVAIRRATTAHIKDEAIWTAARRWFARANHADTEAARPLLLYYVSYMDQGVRPPDLALQGLQKAASLAPEDPGVRWLLASRLLADGDTAGARALLIPSAFSPHGDQASNAARTVIELIDAGKIADAKAQMTTSQSKAADAIQNPPPKS